MEEKRWISPKEEELIRVAQNLPTDFRRLQELVDNGADVNAADPSDPIENVLSMSIMGYAYNSGDGRDLPELCRFFLRNGFDVHGNGNAAGAICLYNLNWCSYDRYILDAAKVLLDAGADASYRVDETEDILETVAIKLSALHHDEENVRYVPVYRAFYEILLAASEGRDYHCIDMA